MFRQYLLQLRILHKLSKKKREENGYSSEKEYEQKVQVNEFLLSKINATTGFIKNRALNLEIRTCSIWQFSIPKYCYHRRKTLYIKKGKGYAKNLNDFKSWMHCMCYGYKYNISKVKHMPKLSLIYARFWILIRERIELIWLWVSIWIREFYNDIGHNTMYMISLVIISFFFEESKL